MSETHLIVGGGLAAGKAAEAMREEGFDGRIVVVTAEGERPYERPPLSKEYLRGEAGREKIYVHEESWYAEHDVELRVGEKVTALDAAGSVATLGSPWLQMTTGRPLSGVVGAIDDERQGDALALP